MRKISADYIFPVSSAPIKDGVITMDDKGVILDVSSETKGKESGVERYEGVIVPGFVNTHCHLELSHLKGKIGEHTGLPGFVSEIISKRDKFSVEQIKSAIVSAEAEMVKNGIVAVGDISNGDHTFDQKKKGNLLYHTFIEAFDLTADKAQHAFDVALSLKSQVSSLNASITPHAPYSVSGKLLELIDNSKQALFSIHNQESAAENEMFASGTGQLEETMSRAGVDIDSKRRAKNPLLYTLGALIESKKILLVHNTYTSKADVELIGHYVQVDECEVTLCLCPNANLYIENRLPDIPMFIEQGMKLTLGTDSYASNWSLSILDEMKTISKHFPEITFDTLLPWATINGAEFLGMDKTLGTIEKGKKPGLNLIKGLDHKKMILPENSIIQKIS